MGSRAPLILGLCLIVASLGLGQTFIPIPDDLPAVGTCNAFPFGSATFTYAARIPTTFMDPINTEVRDLAFAPCGSGTFMAPEFKMALGHVPNPLPVPFTNPVITAGVVVSLGSFLDLVIVHDSDVMGPFQWVYTQDNWSPMGYAAQSGTGFTWDTVNDVGFFVTHQAATGTSTMHRTNTEPFRVYTSGVYQAPSSSGSGANGLKMRLEVAPSVPPVASLTFIGTGCVGSSGLPMTLSSLQVPFIGNPIFSLDLSDGPATSTAYLFVATALASNPFNLGGGCNVYLDLVSMQTLISQGVSPIGPLATGPTGATSWSLPIPPDPGIAGLRIVFQAAAVDATGPFGLVLSNAAEGIIN